MIVIKFGICAALTALFIVVAGMGVAACVTAVIDKLDKVYRGSVDYYFNQKMQFYEELMKGEEKFAAFRKFN